ncbi:hypothetical protein CVT24_011987 [Panaeolus cyanescens]|uniref:Uncharacterized protein n=1 Tax=Panaeolus cyanescens TaxID=181874 RepID=A0A409WWY6_9AGAR|nr:hypothetical protein CVT24_011987 [Panaeolus cyanescens]
MHRYFFLLLQHLGLSAILLATLYGAGVPQIPFFLGSGLGMASLSQTTDPLLRVAIIGAGAGGSSSAFWIARAIKNSNLTISVDLLEQSAFIGGRSFSINQSVSVPFSVELGAHLFEDGHKNMWRASMEFNLPVSRIDAMDQTLHFWNGVNFVRKSPSFWPIVDLLLHHGHPSLALGTTYKRAEQVAARFAEVYQPNFPTWDAPGELVARLGLLDLLISNTSDYFVRTGASQSVVNDIVLPLLGGYTDVPAHALQSLFRMSSSSFYQIPGGTRRIFERFVDLSPASLFLNTTVKSIEHVAGTPRWRVNTTSSSREYDAVILAAPFHQANITTPESLFAKVPLVSYKTVHVTVLVTRSPDVNTTFLADPSHSQDGRFSSISYWRQTAGRWVIRINSQSPLSDDWLSRALNRYDQVEAVFRQKWEHPLQVPTVDLPPIRLEEGFYYLNGFESVVSSMETQIMASFNLVNLLLRDSFGVDVCGSSPTRNHNIPAQRYFVAGWDC